MSKKGWYYESKRHSLAAKGIPSREPRYPKTPVVRVDIEDSLENLKGTNKFPLWYIMMDIYSKSDEDFEKLLNHYGWVSYEDDYVYSFVNKNDNKTITIDNSNNVIIMDHDFYGPDADIEHIENFYHSEKFDDWGDAFRFAVQQVASDIKEKERVNLTR